MIWDWSGVDCACADGLFITPVPPWFIYTTRQRRPFILHHNEVMIIGGIVARVLERELVLAIMMPERPMG